MHGRLMLRAAVAAAVFVLLVVQMPASVHAVATTFTVTVTSDDAGSSCVGPCSLRQAINAANANPGTDTIEFEITAALVDGAHTIVPTSPLPQISQPVTIDATTDADFASCADGPVIEIVGSSAGAGANGLDLTFFAGASTVRGLAINSFGGAGVYLNAPGAAVRCSFLGTDAAGTTARANTYGVRLGRPGTVGGTGAGDGNLISGNTAGVYVQTNDAVIQGNLIGTDATGTLDLGNANAGIYVENSTRAQIGGTNPGAGNVISGNRTGIEIYGPSNQIVANRIGTTADGFGALGNSLSGIQIGSGGNPAPTGNVVGGTVAGAGNIIAFNGGSGVLIQDNSDTTINNPILGNSIHSNGGLGIRLGGTGVEPNDPGDGDGGPNRLQNFPVLTSATSGAPERHQEPERVEEHQRVEVADDVLLLQPPQEPLPQQPRDPRHDRVQPDPRALPHPVHRARRHVPHPRVPDVQVDEHVVREPVPRGRSGRGRAARASAARSPCSPTASRRRASSRTRSSSAATGPRCRGSASAGSRARPRR